MLGTTQPACDSCVFTELLEGISIMEYSIYCPDLAPRDPSLSLLVPLVCPKPAICIREGIQKEVDLILPLLTTLWKKNVCVFCMLSIIVNHVLDQHLISRS